MKTVLLVLFLVLPSVSFAAYQNPVVKSNTTLANGNVQIGFEFSGNAGEPVVIRSFIVQKGTTAQELRNWVDDIIKELDLVNTASKLAVLQPGQTVPRLARVEPAPTAKQIWLSKFHRYLSFKDSGVAAIASDLAAIKSDLEATYQAGYLDGQP